MLLSSTRLHFWHYFHLKMKTSCYFHFTKCIKIFDEISYLPINRPPEAFYSIQIGRLEAFHWRFYRNVLHAIVSHQMILHRWLNIFLYDSGYCFAFLLLHDAICRCWVKAFLNILDISVSIFCSSFLFVLRRFLRLWHYMSYDEHIAGA